MIPLPPLGLGCAGLGNLYRAVPDRVADETVAAALAGGITLFDVAPFYGFGLAEERLGRALAGRDDVLVSTKVGRLLVPAPGAAGVRHGYADAAPFEPVFDYRGDAVKRSVEGSLHRLRRDRVTILLAHDVGAATHGAEAERHWRDLFSGGWRALADLRAAGVTGAIGVGVNEIAACERVLDEADPDAILLAGRYTLLEQEAAVPLLDRCLRAGVAVIVGGPFNSGVLVEGGPERHFDYAAAPPAVLARAAALGRACDAAGVPLPAAALRFPRRHPAVASVIPGLVGRGQVEAALAWARAPIPDALWEALR